MELTLLRETFAVALDWLGSVIQWLIGIGSIVGVGIILFTVILKTVMLPLDAFSKVKMRKNNLKMEKMRPQLEKLQKQYANDKQAYNMKMMELYKKNGYSMLGPCLPMIVTLVIFIFVMSAFSSYSGYMNLHTYEQMAEAYNTAIVAYGADTGEDAAPKSETLSEYYPDAHNYIYTVSYDDEAALLSVTLEYTYESEDATLSASDPEDVAFVREEVLGGKASSRTPHYFAKTEAVLAAVESEEEQFAPLRSAVDALTKAGITRENSVDGNGAQSDAVYARTVMQQVGRNASSSIYHSVRDSFLWVGNIWEPDVSYEHPVSRPDGMAEYEYEFTETTWNLGAEKTQANGYFVLIILSVGFMFLSQFILSRSQKAQNELQTADGRGKKTQKIMMIVMPIIYGVFAFFYSAAFTIYMITSSVYNVVSTLIINAIIDRRFRKREEQEIIGKYNKRVPQKAVISAGSNRQSVNKQLARKDKLRTLEKESAAGKKNKKEGK